MDGVAEELPELERRAWSAPTSEQDTVTAPPSGVGLTSSGSRQVDRGGRQSR